MAIDEGDCTVRTNCHVCNNLVLALHAGNVALVVLSLRLGPHLDSGDGFFFPGEEVEFLIELLVRLEVCVKVPSEDDVKIGFGVAKSAKVLFETSHLRTVLVFAGAEMGIDEENIIYQ